MFFLLLSISIHTVTEYKQDYWLVECFQKSQFFFFLNLESLNGNCHTSASSGMCPEIVLVRGPSWTIMGKEWRKKTLNGTIPFVEE